MAGIADDENERAFRERLSTPLFPFVALDAEVVGMRRLTFDAGRSDVVVEILIDARICIGHPAIAHSEGIEAADLVEFRVLIGDLDRLVRRRERNVRNAAEEQFDLIRGQAGHFEQRDRLVLTVDRAVPLDDREGCALIVEAFRVVLNALIVGCGPKCLDRYRVTQAGGRGH